MIKHWIALMGMVACLAACAGNPGEPHAKEPWNGGVWNSVLGYHGPGSAMVDGGPSS